MAQSTVQIICKRKGLKNLVKKIIWLQAFSACSGIWRQEGRQWVSAGSGNKKIKLAKLASVLETDASWTQTKTATIPTADGYTITIPKGAILHRPSRPFIMLWKLKDAWNDMRDRVRAFIITYLNKTTIRGGRTNSKHVIDAIAEEMAVKQREVMTNQQARNSEITQKIKGFDFPLIDSSKMLQAIRGKNKRTAESGMVKEQSLKFLTQIDKMIAEFNRK